MRTNKQPLQLTARIITLTLKNLAAATVLVRLVRKMTSKMI
jgi:hypothetical protein